MSEENGAGTGLSWSYKKRTVPFPILYRRRLNTHLIERWGSLFSLHILLPISSIVSFRGTSVNIEETLYDTRISFSLSERFCKRSAKSNVSLIHFCGYCL